MNTYMTTPNTSRAKPMHQVLALNALKNTSRAIHILLELMGVVSVIVSICFLCTLASMHYFAFPTAGKLVVVRSGSMEPAVPLGSLVWLQPQARYDVGQVIAYTHPDSNNNHTVVLHRIETKTESVTTTYQTKGDANGSIDAVSVSESDIYGAMKYQFTFIGHVLTWVQSQVGVLITIIFPIILVISHKIRSFLVLDM